MESVMASQAAAAAAGTAAAGEQQGAPGSLSWSHGFTAAGSTGSCSSCSGSPTSAWRIPAGMQGTPASAAAAGHWPGGCATPAGLGLGPAGLSAAPAAAGGAAPAELSFEVHEEQEVAGCGRFTAYEDGRVKVGGLPASDLGCSWADLGCKC
jgi:hypothetical protein